MPAAETPASTADMVRYLVRGAIKATLSTAMAGGEKSEAGWAYGSLVTMATTVDGQPILLLSELSDHTRNLAHDSRASLLIDGTEGHQNPQSGPRVTLMGRILQSSDDGHRRRFLARHPDAALYAGFADFKIYTMKVERAHLVGGFARAHWLEAKKFTEDVKASKAIAVAEPGVLDHMNQDHADAVALYGQAILGKRGKHWRLISVDPRGCDLRCGARIHRLPFSAPVADAASLRDEFVRLAGVARHGGRTKRNQ